MKNSKNPFLPDGGKGFFVESCKYVVDIITVLLLQFIRK